MSIWEDDSFILGEGRWELFTKYESSVSLAFIITVQNIAFTNLFKGPAMKHSVCFTDTNLLTHNFKNKKASCFLFSDTGNYPIDSN